MALILITPELKELMQAAFFALGRSQQITEHQETCEDCKNREMQIELGQELIKGQIEMLTKKVIKIKKSDKNT